MFYPHLPALSSIPFLLRNQTLRIGASGFPKDHRLDKRFHTFPYSAPPPTLTRPCRVTRVGGFYTCGLTPLPHTPKSRKDWKMPPCMAQIWFDQDFELSTFDHQQTFFFLKKRSDFCTLSLVHEVATLLLNKTLGFFFVNKVKEFVLQCSLPGK